MNFNEWFVNLERGRQKALREDKWILADAAWAAAKEQGFREAEKMGEVNLFSRNRGRKS